jgi:hypothetical protein
MTSPLILAESMDTDASGSEMEGLRKQAKKLLETIARSGESSAVYTSGNFYFIHITENDVCYLTLCDGSYPKKLAYSFLEELKKEFDVQHGAEVSKTKRPFAFELFGMETTLQYGMCRCAHLLTTSFWFSKQIPSSRRLKSSTWTQNPRGT